MCRDLDTGDGYSLDTDVAVSAKTIFKSEGFQPCPKSHFLNGSHKKLLQWLSLQQDGINIEGICEVTS